MANKIVIHNSLEHIVVYGYFEHAFELYLSHIKPKNITAEQVVEMQMVFRNIRYKLRNNTYLAPAIIDSMGNKTQYPFSPKFTDEELFWFKKIIILKFSLIKSKTKSYIKLNKIILKNIPYFELYRNLRTDAAIIYLHSEFLKRNSF